MAKKRRLKYGAALLDNEPSSAKPSDDARTREARAYKHWMEEIDTAKKEFKDYWARGRKIVKLYKDDRKSKGEVIGSASDRMNILWSNVETLKPALYSKTPMPNVSRRFMDSDPVSRTAAMILERCLVTVIELTDIDYPLSRARDDYLLPGRGTVWIRFAPQKAMIPYREPVTKIDLGSRAVYRPFKGGDEIPEDKIKEDEEGLYYEGDPEEQILAYGLDLDHLLWTDYLHEPVNDWTKIGWQAKRVDMKRSKLIKLFGDEKGRKVKLNKTFNARPKEEGADGGGDRGKPDCAEVWEIWSKDHKCVYWVTDGLPDELLKHEEDPLGLHDFWPLPRPLFATTTTDSLIPTPDYALYQDQAEQLDKLTDRIRLLIEALRVVGVYNAEMTSLDQLLNETGENQMVPVESWMTFAQSGGLKGNLDWLPIEMIATVLTQLFSARAQIKNDLYEITGISDVIRGATAPEETATAQQIKANFGNLRLQARQGEMARFARDTIRKMAEIIAEHYSEDALIEMSGVLSMDEFKQTGDPQKDAAAQMKVKQAVTMLKSDKLRTFKVDIETDATVAPDQQKEKEARVEFLSAVAPFLEKAAMVGAQAPQLVPLLLKMLDFGVKGFRAGRTLENAIEETIGMAEKVQAEAQANPQQAPADPAAEAMAAKLQAETEKIKAELAQLQAEAQVKAQENEAKKLEAEERRNRERETFRQTMLKVTQEVENRRLEHEKQCKLLELQIAKAELELQQLGATPELPQEQVGADTAENVARASAAQIQLLENKKRFVQLQQELAGIEGLGGALSAISTDDIGTPLFNKPKKRTKKFTQFIHDDQTGKIIGGTTEEIEIEDNAPDNNPDGGSKQHQFVRDDSGALVGVMTEDRTEDAA